ncbi:MAG: 2-oxo acid dehydrogenase subunit E2 [Bacteroidia bacterium]|nr:2-oxo acid dehydrogenase subunit E2 [Bacteroidia bacterium]
MPQFELIMPKMGESVAEATIIKWSKNEGDNINTDETVLEIATDKVDTEVPSPFAGKLLKKLFNEGDVVQVGKVIAIIGDGDVTATAPVASDTTTAPDIKVADVVTESNDITTQNNYNNSNKFYSPLVKNIAKAEGVSLQELEAIAGTGANGRVTKNDVLDYIPQRGAQQASPTPQAIVTPALQTATVAPTATKSNVWIGPNDEIIEMDRMRKLIADHMVMSKQTSPHVTSFVECDVTNMVAWREKNKKEFEKREKEKITFTPLFIEAVARAIKDFPMVNVSVDGNRIIKRKEINIGMAAALPSGNLIVPVIRNADQKNLIGLTKAVNDFAARARANKLQADEIQGGTFTISNVGNFGNVMGTPIINQPQVAILATGAIRKKPAVMETEFGDVIAVRQMMYLSLSYDHRVVDGMLGGSFLRKIADYLEQFDVNRPF